MRGTRPPPRRIEKGSRDSPPRPALPGRLRLWIVARAGLETRTALTATAFMGLKLNLDPTGGIGVPILTPAEGFAAETADRL